MSTLRSGLSVIPELRTCTVMFIDFLDITIGEPDTCLALQSCIELVLQNINTLGGELRQLIEDDKGFVGIAIWGWPMATHEDDPCRAVDCALRVRKALTPLGVPVSIGITSGPCFCGLVGNQRRCEYVAVGDTVNRAARLMAADRGTIFCDEEVRRRCGNKFDFSSPRQLRMKGKTELQNIFECSQNVLSNADKAEQGSFETIGRDLEIATITETIKQLGKKGFQGYRKFILIEGDAGHGKSHLLTVAQVPHGRTHSRTHGRTH
jgi:class 3 adenylate cyclase